MVHVQQLEERRDQSYDRGENDTRELRGDHAQAILNHLVVADVPALVEVRHDPGDASHHLVLFFAFVRLGCEAVGFEFVDEVILTYRQRLVSRTDTLCFLYDLF